MCGIITVWGDKTMIEWRPVTDYEDLYEVSNTGEVRRIIPRYSHVTTLKQYTSNKGYKLVCLCRNGIQKTISVHRLVALAFIPNPDCLPCVNHIDENKANNNVSNLEWCSYLRNNIYGHRLEKSASKRSKAVICVETGIVYASAYEAQRLTGIHQSKISECCNGNRQTTAKCHWSFV